MLNFVIIFNKQNQFILNHIKPIFIFHLANESELIPVFIQCFNLLITHGVCKVGERM